MIYLASPSTTGGMVTIIHLDPVAEMGTVITLQIDTRHADLRVPYIVPQLGIPRGLLKHIWLVIEVCILRIQGRHVVCIVMAAPVLIQSRSVGNAVKKTLVAIKKLSSNMIYLINTIDYDLPVQVSVRGTRQRWVYGNQRRSTKLAEHPIWIVVLHYPEMYEWTSIEPHLPLLLVSHTARQEELLVQLIVRRPLNKRLRQTLKL